MSSKTGFKKYIKNENICIKSKEIELTRNTEITILKE